MSFRVSIEYRDVLLTEWKCAHPEPCVRTHAHYCLCLAIRAGEPIYVSYISSIIGSFYTRIFTFVHVLHYHFNCYFNSHCMQQQLVLNVLVHIGTGCPISNIFYLWRYKTNIPVTKNSNLPAFYYHLWLKTNIFYCSRWEAKNIVNCDRNKTNFECTDLFCPSLCCSCRHKLCTKELKISFTCSLAAQVWCGYYHWWFVG